MIGYIRHCLWYDEIYVLFMVVQYVVEHGFMLYSWLHAKIHEFLTWSRKKEIFGVMNSTTSDQATEC